MFRPNKTVSRVTLEISSSCTTSSATMMGLSRPILPASDRPGDPFLPSLSDPAQRSSLLLKLALVALHFLFPGILLLFHPDFLGKTDPWYLGSYFLLLLATLVQYLVTSGSSPGYVVDAMRDVCDANAVYSKAPIRQPASSENESVIVSLEGGHFTWGAGLPTSWAKVVLDLYPPGTCVRNLTCNYCHVEQPPRSKHCHDCDRCVLQFDHHCLWIGTCIGQNNHCNFWWYVCGETVLCIWTLILCIDYLDNISKYWWKNAIIILLLVILAIFLIFVLLLLIFHSYLITTNQTTYEFVRRRRIPYLRNIPERVHPFSRGMCRNIYNVCCGKYNLEPLPTAYEVEQQISRPYTCLDLFKCRSC